MRFHCVAAIVLRQLYLLRGSPVRVLPIFAWVAVDIVLWGFITRYLNTFAAPGFNFVPVLLGAVLLWDFFTRIMHGVSMAFLEDVWTHNFLNLFASPLSIGEYLCGHVISSIATGALGLFAMIALASVLFGLSFLVYGLMLVPFLLVLFLFGISLGILSSGIVLRFGPASEWLVWPVPAILSPFAAVFYPLSTLPHWMQQIAILLPPTYVFEGMRAILAGSALRGSTLLWSAGLAAMYILIATWFFSRIHRHAVRTGLLARYSAESVT
jgi:ABC-2 type transport system permease protein